METVIGIDPGLKGGIAVVKEGTLADLYDMPVVPRVKGKGMQVNGYELAEIIGKQDKYDSIVKIENVHSMPGQGVSSTFKFGESFGIIIGVCQALSLKMEFITPSVWKRKAGLIGKDKDVARTLSIQRHPSWAGQLKLKKHGGRADAILIAEFG